MKNINAQELTRLRNVKLSPERRAQISSDAAKARWSNTTKEERQAHASKAGSAPKKPRKNKPPVTVKSPRKMTLTHKTGKNRQSVIKSQSFPK